HPLQLQSRNIWSPKAPLSVATTAENSSGRICGLDGSRRAVDRLPHWVRQRRGWKQISKLVRTMETESAQCWLITASLDAITDSRLASNGSSGTEPSHQPHDAVSHSAPRITPVLRPRLTLRTGNPM